MLNLNYFYSPSDLDGEQILCYAEQNVFIQSHTVQRKHNDKTALIMLGNGSGKLCLQNSEYNISSEVITILDSTVSQFRFSGFEKSTSYVLLEVSANDLLSVLNRHDSCIILPINPSRHAWEGFVALAIEYCNAPIFHQEYVLCRINELLILLLRSRCEKDLQAICNNMESTSLMFKNYIDEHYRENITIESLATTFHMSTSNLSHTFKERYGLSPISYLIKVRITIAMQLLATTGLSVREISDTVGYENPNYFSLLFKKNTGENPSEFRQKTRRRI